MKELAKLILGLSILVPIAIGGYYATIYEFVGIILMSVLGITLALIFAWWLGDLIIGGGD